MSHSNAPEKHRWEKVRLLSIGPLSPSSASSVPAIRPAPVFIHKPRNRVMWKRKQAKMLDCGKGEEEVFAREAREPPLGCQIWCHKARQSRRKQPVWTLCLLSSLLHRTVPPPLILADAVHGLTRSHLSLPGPIRTPRECQPTNQPPPKKINKNLLAISFLHHWAMADVCTKEAIIFGASCWETIRGMWLQHDARPTGVYVNYVEGNCCQTESIKFKQDDVTPLFLVGNLGRRVLAVADTWTCAKSYWRATGHCDAPVAENSHCHFTECCKIWL